VGAGAGGGRQANMDGEFCTQLRVELEREEKPVSFGLTTNTPNFFMAPSSCAYCAYATTFEALEVPYFHTWLGNLVGIPWNSMIILILDLFNSHIFIEISFF
jgi:hypothetical protein